MLGVQWLKLLGPINWDFTNMTMQFVVQGNELTLKGLNFEEISVEATDKQLKSSFMRKQAWLLQMVTIEEKKEVNQLQPEIT